ncbi:MAG: DUF4465 domain-containing protein [Bacteroidetes bacterium]|nr:DUF4465 domain-containing protein [Bacteroidota bacterium]
MKHFNLTLIISFICSNLFAQSDWMSSFESFQLDGLLHYSDGSDLSGGFQDKNAFFVNDFNTDWMTWGGFAVSANFDTSTTGFTNLYSTYAGHAVSYSNQFAVFGISGTVRFSKSQTIRGCYVSNSTYSAISMRDGDQFAKKFGGSNGTDKDYFLLTATGFRNGISNTTEFYLADFRSDKKSEDFILKEWKYFPLEVLGDVDSIVFSLSSSDTGQFGMNTPAFFCLDDFNSVNPDDSKYSKLCDFSSINLAADTFDNGSEANGGFYTNGYYFANTFNPDWNTWSGFSLSSKSDSITVGFSNQYSSVVANFDENTYLTAYGKASIYLPFNEDIHYVYQDVGFGLLVSNSTYGYYTMKNGDQFAKKFGGTSGNDPDYLELKVSGVNYEGKSLDTVSLMLADFRFGDNSKDYILKDWNYLDISYLFENGGNTSAPVRLDFWLEGSDTGQFGLNTPAYFCMDSVFQYKAVGIKKLKTINFNMFPNPANETINLSGLTGEIQFRIIGLDGREFIEGNSTGAIDIALLANGMYILNVVTEEGSGSQIFIKN